MDIYYDPKHGEHAPAEELKDGEIRAPFESVARLEKALAALSRAGHRLIDQVPDRGRAPFEAVHDSDYLAFLEYAWAMWQKAGRRGDLVPLVWPAPGMHRGVSPETIDGQIGKYAFDSGTPITAGTWPVVCRAAQIAAEVADQVGKGASAMALTRPPGHHAGADYYGGYCFLNYAAIAAEALTRAGHKTAVLDIDYHHGNGTQAIFEARPDVLVVNLHADPVSEYPYFLGHARERGFEAGVGATLNLPLPAGTMLGSYREALQRGLNAIRDFGAERLVLSFGADTFGEDPLGKFALVTADYEILGRDIAGLNLPTAVILEGGYAIDALGDNIVSLLRGLG